MKKGYLSISLDVEYAWGRIGTDQNIEFIPLFEKTTEAIDCTLNLFQKYDIPATWACVGRLIEDPAKPSSGFHEDLQVYFPNISNDEIYNSSVFNNSENSFVSQPNLIEKICRFNKDHEICSHGYNHIFYGEQSDPTLVENDLNAVSNLHRHIGIPVNSLVFPKNQENYFDLVKKSGIKYYRGTTVEHFANSPNIVRKCFRQVDAFLPFSPPTMRPIETEHGLLNIPGTMLFRTSHLGLKKFYPTKLLEWKAKNSLKKSALRKEITHLWWHPFNFGFKLKAHLSALENVLEFASALRDRGDIDILTMQAIGNRFRKGEL